MSDVLVDAVADRIGPDPATFASLPLLLALRIFLALPVDARGRACCVCRAWRDALAEPSLWTRLDMSGVDRDNFRFVMRGALGRARDGELCRLDLSEHHVGREELLQVLTANAGSLRELHLRRVVRPRARTSQVTVKAVVAAAPLLQVLTAEEALCTWEAAPLMLRAEPPFALLRLRGTLVVRFDAREFEPGQHLVDASWGGLDRVGPFAAALADAALQPALLQVCVWRADISQPALMDALVDAALARRLPELALRYCTPPAAAPLARLLVQGTLASLVIGPWEGGMPALFDAAGAALVADALRVNTLLTKLELYGVHLCRDLSMAGVLLGALIGHSSLRALRITRDHAVADNRSAFGAMLAALIAADAPALRVFEVFICNDLKDAGLAPIMKALPLNHHLRELDLHGNGTSEAFMRKRLLPAVRANTSLRTLRCQDSISGPLAAWEAEELVRRRGQHD